MKKNMYEKAWNYFLQTNMTEKDVCAKANISSSTLHRIRKGESVEIEVYIRFLKAIKYDPDKTSLTYSLEED